MAYRLGKGRALQEAMTLDILKVGRTFGTDVKGLALKTATLSPAEVGANTSAEQTFALPGVLVDDMITVVKPTAAQAGLGIVGVRVSATDQVAITFGNFTAAPIVPTASELYRFAVLRP